MVNKKNSLDLFVLQDRDIEILVDLLEKKVMTPKQIKDKFFPNAIMHVVRKRLRILRRNKLIRFVNYDFEGNMARAISLGKKSSEILSQMDNFNVQAYQEKSDSIRHDLMFGEIWDKLKSFSELSDFLTENMLKSCKDYQNDPDLRDFVNINCDGTFKVNQDGESLRAAFEYERSSQSKFRYIGKVDEYYHADSIGLVLYVCEKESTMKIISEIQKSKKDRKFSKIFFCCYDTFLNAKDHLIFQNLDDGFLIISKEPNF